MFVEVNMNKWLTNDWLMKKSSSQILNKRLINYGRQFKHLMKKSYKSTLVTISRGKGEEKNPSVSMEDLILPLPNPPG